VVAGVLVLAAVVVVDTAVAARRDMGVATDVVDTNTADRGAEVVVVVVIGTVFEAGGVVVVAIVAVLVPVKVVDGAPVGS
jgi:hypothetical protein